MRPERIGDQLRDQLGANDGVVMPVIAVDDKQVDGQFQRIALVMLSQGPLFFQAFIAFCHYRAVCADRD